MNQIIDIKKFDGQSENLEKSAYKSIIYCFSGSLSCVDGQNNVEITKNQLLIIPKNVAVSLSGNKFTATQVTIKDATIQTDKIAKIDDLDGNPIAFCVNEICKYIDQLKPQDEIILNALGGLMSGYVTANLGKSGVNGLSEEIKRTLTKNVGNCDFKIDEYLKSLPLNTDYLKKLFKKQTGFTPHEYLTKLRFDKAKIMLSGTDRFNYTIKQVAYQCGYQDALYFSRLFKKKFSYSPKDYAHRFDKKVKKKVVGSLVENDV